MNKPARELDRIGHLSGAPARGERPNLDARTASRIGCSQAPAAAALREAIRNRSFRLALQPIVELDSGRCMAFEALSRFPDGRPSDAWFRAADRLGLGLQLELAAVAKALELLHSLPEGISMSVNVSPATLESGELAKAIRGYPCNRVIFEITEHAHVGDDEALADQARHLQGRGARIAVDDLGAGYSSLRQVLRLAPDFIKLDRSLVSGVANDPAKRALMSGLLLFAAETGAEMVAEGIEKPVEFDVLLSLGVRLGQGWLTGRPVELSAALAQVSVLRHAGMA